MRPSRPTEIARHGKSNRKERSDVVLAPTVASGSVDACVRSLGFRRRVFPVRDGLFPLLPVPHDQWPDCRTAHGGIPLDTAGLGLLTSVYFLTFAACQLPYGPLLDRFGPRRVQALVPVIAVLGATLFAVAPNTPTLVLARALIGIGTSGALMAGLKALTLWVPPDRLALANGSFIMFGGLGAMTSTVPVTLLLPVFGWRGVFVLLAALTLASSALVLVVVPEKRGTAPAENWRDNLRGLLAIYRDPVFWRLAPLSTCVIGTAFAVHGLWAARWLADVDGFGSERIASVVFVMGVGLTLGAAVIGLVADRLHRHGVPSATTFGLACTLFIVLQATVLDRLPLPGWLQWGTIASFGSMTVLSYSIMGELFPAEQIGRANGALNVLHLSMAFVLQYGMGVVTSLWHPDAFGHLPVSPTVRPLRCLCYLSSLPSSGSSYHPSVSDTQPLPSRPRQTCRRNGSNQMSNIVLLFACVVTGMVVA